MNKKLLIALVLFLPLSGCGGSNDNSNNEQQEIIYSKNPDGKNEFILVIQMVSPTGVHTYVKSSSEDTSIKAIDISTELLKDDHFYRKIYLEKEVVGYTDTSGNQKIASYCDEYYCLLNVDNNAMYQRGNKEFKAPNISPFSIELDGYTQVRVDFETTKPHLLSNERYSSKRWENYYYAPDWFENSEYPPAGESAQVYTRYICYNIWSNTPNEPIRVDFVPNARVICQ